MGAYSVVAQPDMAVQCQNLTWPDAFGVVGVFLCVALMLRWLRR